MASQYGPDFFGYTWTTMATTTVDLARVKIILKSSLS